MDLYFSVCRGRQGSQVDIINRPENGLKVQLRNKTELDVPKVAMILELKDEELIQIIDEIQSKLKNKDKD